MSSVRGRGASGCGREKVILEVARKATAACVGGGGGQGGHRLPKVGCQGVPLPGRVGLLSLSSISLMMFLLLFRLDMLSNLILLHNDCHKNCNFAK